MLDATAAAASTPLAEANGALPTSDPNAMAVDGPVTAPSASSPRAAADTAAAPDAATAAATDTGTAPTASQGDPNGGPTSPPPAVVSTAPNAADGAATAASGPAEPASASTSASVPAPATAAPVPAPAPVKPSLPPPRHDAEPKSTAIPLYAAIPQYKHISSSFSRQHASRILGKSPQGPLPIPTNGDKIIILHPGSRTLRLGLATDTFPKEVPHLVARRMKGVKKRAAATVAAQNGTAARTAKRSALGHDAVANAGAPVKDESTQASRGEDGEDDDDDTAPDGWSESAFRTRIAPLLADLKHRLKVNKIRPVSNGHAQVVNYNTQSEPQMLAEHNDPSYTEWTRVDEVKDGATAPRTWVIGQEALCLDDRHLAPRGPWCQFYPLRYGMLNTADYASAFHALQDCALIWREAIIHQLGIKPSDFHQYAVILIIPDLFSRVYVQQALEVLLRELGFMQCMAHVESVCATYGAGMSSGCVVDVGAQKTSIMCVEDGVALTETRIQLKLGGDDISTMLANLLRLGRFPLAEPLDVTRATPSHAVLVDDVKQTYVTANLSDFTTQVCQTFYRQEDQRTQQISFKLYDEPLLSVLSLFDETVLPSHRLPASPRKERGPALAASDVDPVANVYDAETLNDPVVWGYELADAIVQANAAPATEAGEPPTGSATVRTAGSKEDLAARPETGAGVPEARGTPAAGTPTAAGDVADATPAGAETAKPLAGVPPAPAAPELPPLPPSTAPVPLDVAIAVSLLWYAVSSGLTDAKNGFKESRWHAMTDSILLVGGGAARIPGMVVLLEHQVRHQMNVLRSLIQTYQQQMQPAPPPPPPPTTTTTGSSEMLSPGAPAAAATASSPAATAALAAADRILTRIPEVVRQSPIVPEQLLGEASLREHVVVVASPRDMDSRWLVWKGGAVLGRIALDQEEMWIERDEFLLRGPRGCGHKFLFSWDA